MNEHRTGRYKQLFCKKCKKKTKHWNWHDEVSYKIHTASRILSIFLTKNNKTYKTDIKMVSSWECSKCHTWIRGKRLIFCNCFLRTRKGETLP